MPLLWRSWQMHLPNERGGLLIARAVFSTIGALLIVLAQRKPAERTSAAKAICAARIVGPRRWPNGCKAARWYHSVPRQDRQHPQEYPDRYRRFSGCCSSENYDDVAIVSGKQWGMMGGFSEGWSREVSSNIGRARLVARYLRCSDSCNLVSNSPLAFP
jgi:hypothetical protein